jgi:hypothetical protein
MFDGRNIHQAHPLILRDDLAWISAIDRYVVATFRKPASDFFNSGLKTTVLSRHTAGAKKSNLHVNRRSTVTANTTSLSLAIPGDSCHNHSRERLYSRIVKILLGACRD